VLSDLMRDIEIPNGIGAVGFGEGDIGSLVDGALKQQRLLATCPRDVTRTTSPDLLALARAVVRARSGKGGGSGALHLV
jgi:alcohol dehydrogenase class IV